MALCHSLLFFLIKQSGLNQAVYFYISSKTTLRYSVFNFPLKDNIVETKYSISNFSKNWHYTIQFYILRSETTWFKRCSLFLSFLKNDIILFSEHSVSSDKTRWFKPSSFVLNFLKKDVTLFNTEFTFKTRHGSNQVAYF